MFQEQKHYGPPFKFCTSFWRMLPGTLVTFIFASLVLLGTLYDVQNGQPIAQFDTPPHIFTAIIRIVGVPFFYFNVFVRFKLGLSDKPVITVDENGWSSRYQVVQRINWAYIERVGIQRQMGSNVIGVVLKKKQVSTKGMTPKATSRVLAQLKKHGMIGVAPEYLLPMKLEDIYHLVSPYVAQMVAKNAAPAQPP